MGNDEDIYKTSDLYLSAYLKAKGHKIEDIERGVKKCYFIFENSERLMSDRMRFFNEGLISVTQYKNALQDLRVLIHNC